jgi:hypothetical protein
MPYWSQMQCNRIVVVAKHAIDVRRIHSDGGVGERSCLASCAAGKYVFLTRFDRTKYIHHKHANIKETVLAVTVRKLFSIAAPNARTQETIAPEIKRILASLTPFEFLLISITAVTAARGAKTRSTTAKNGPGFVLRRRKLVETENHKQMMYRTSQPPIPVKYGSGLASADRSVRKSRKLRFHRTKVAISPGMNNNISTAAVFG